MLNFVGVVTSGLQKAGMFMKKDTYRQQYQEKLGFIRYNGTLNVKLKNDVEINLKEKFNDKLKIIKGNENLGDVYFLEAEIYTLNKEVSEKGAILFPTKTVHKIDTIEFVAKNRLREKMNLKDNTQVIVSIDY
jgi:riboflavin kinase